MKTWHSKPMGCSKSRSKDGSLQQYNLPQETRKTSNRQPNFTPKATGNRRRRKKPKLVEGKKS